MMSLQGCIAAFFHLRGNALGLIPQLLVAANMTRLSLSLAGASFLLIGLISLVSVPILKHLARDFPEF